MERDGWKDKTETGVYSKNPGESIGGEKTESTLQKLQMERVGTRQEVDEDQGVSSGNSKALLHDLGYILFLEAVHFERDAASCGENFTAIKKKGGENSINPKVPYVNQVDNDFTETSKQSKKGHASKGGK